MLVSSGIRHEVISRSSGGSLTKLDIVEGTFQMFKIETRKMLSPLKLYINYDKSLDSQRGGAPAAKAQ